MTLSWEDIVNRSRGANVHVSRKPNVQRAYEDRKAMVKATFKSYVDMIKVECLEFALSTTKPYKAIRKINSRDYALTTTPFPFDIEAGVTHNVLWSLTPLSDQEIKNIIERKFRPQCFKYVYYENALKDKSVPDIWHVHVFVVGAPHILLRYVKL